MNLLELIQHDDIHELRLNRPPVNALDGALIRALRDAIIAAPANGARGIVISGSPGLFSAGLDVPALLQLDRAQMTKVWEDFFAMLGAVACSPIPCVAAITGHSPAGGAVLSIFCDYRVMATGAFRIGLNEVQVGLTVPEPVQFALRRLLGAYRAERLMVAGSMIESAEALQVGLVDELIEPDLVIARAIGWLQELLQLPQHALRNTRRIARADLSALFENPSALDTEAFVDDWFAPETQAVLHALVAQLKAGKR